MYDIEFNDYIEKYKNINSEEWIILYDKNEKKNLENDIFTFCALINVEDLKKNEYMKKYDWGFSTDSFGRAGFGTYSWGDGSGELFYFDGRTHDDFEYLIALRSFEKYEELVEINHKLIWYGNLVKQNEGYVDPITDELLIKVCPTHIEVRRKYLKDFLCAEKKVCVIVFDHRRYFKSTDKVNERYREYQGENYYIAFSSSDARGVDREYTGCASIIGKVIIMPLKKPHHADYKYFTEDEQFETFIIDYDEDEEENVEFTCNEKDLANYFGANPEAPHFLTPVYFDIKVLDKYKNDPRNYKISDSNITFLDIWTIPFNINKERKVSVWLGDLGRIPYEEQKYWRQFNIEPTGQMENKFVQRQKYGIWTDASRVESKLLSSISRFNSMITELYEDVIFKLLSDADKEIYNTFMLPTNYSIPEYQSFLIQLSKLTAESINTKLIKNIMGESYNKEISSKGSVLQLGEFLKFTKLDDTERVSSSIRKAYNCRNKLAGHTASYGEYNMLWGRDTDYKFNSVEDARLLIEDIVTAIEYVINSYEARANETE
ncbi:MAG: hypothetical protein PHD56_03590 [Anaerostipes sp.]|nr:hypothetical protein [Anaerostipes sp.]